MAGWFSNRYTKAGPGVYKDDPQKNRFFYFFELLWRKLGELVKLNATLVLTLMPLVLLSIGVFFLLRVSSFSIRANWLMAVFLILSPFMLAGPAVTAATRIARDFVREEPVFVWADYWETFRSEWKQSLALSVLDYVALCAVGAALPFYYYSDFGVFSYLLFAVSIVVAVLLLFAQTYLFLISVSFDLPFTAVIKNTFVLAATCIGRNLLALLIRLALVALCVVLAWYGLVFSEYLWILLVALTLLILFSFQLFCDSYLAFPALQKYIIDPYYADHPQETAEGLEQAEAAGEDLPEYVYHNGRMVHRSVMQQEVLFQDKPADPARRTGEDSPRDNHR